MGFSESSPSTPPDGVTLQDTGGILAIKDLGVTQPKVMTGTNLIGEPQQAKGTTDISTTSTTLVDMTDMSVTFTPTGTGTKHCIAMFNAKIDITTGIVCGMVIDKDGTTIKTVTEYHVGAGTTFVTANIIAYFDVTGGTPTTIKTQWQASGASIFQRDAGGGGLTFTNCDRSLIVMQVD